MFNLFNGCSRSPRLPNRRNTCRMLHLEQLQAREMMAADLLVGPVPMDSVSAPAILQQPNQAASTATASGDITTNIWNGTVTSGFESVGFITDGSFLCTATLISPYHVLTAAHCGGATKFFLGGSSTTTATQVRTVAREFIHPEFGRALSLHDDIAILELSTGVWNVTPTPIFRGALRNGDIVTVVGYGRDQSGKDSSGIKRFGSARLDDVEDKKLKWEWVGFNSGEVRTDKGDSGGPLFLTVDGHTYVAGVHSYGVPGWMRPFDGFDDQSVDMRVDAYAGWIDSIVNAFRDSARHEDIVFVEKDGDRQRVVAWQMADGQRREAIALGHIPSHSQLVGSGDLNHDGENDLLFQEVSTSGTRIVAWWMHEGRRVDAAELGVVPSHARVATLGDLNNDGQTDILFQEGTRVVAWWMRGGERMDAVALGDIPSHSRIAGISDLNNDGQKDILFQEGTRVVAWWMRGGQRMDAVALGDIPSHSRIAGVSDLNNDGQTDILFQEGTRVVAWWMRGGQRMAAVALGDVPPYSKVVGIGDVDGDGQNDLVLEESFDTNKRIVGWTIEDGRRRDAVLLGYVARDTIFADIEEVFPIW